MDKDTLIELITQEVMKRLFAKKALVLCDEKSENLNLAFLEGYSLENYKEGLDIDDYELIVVPKLSIENISALALGLPNDKMVGIIIRALFKGKKVIVLKEGLEHRQYKETAKGNLYKLYLDYENKITALGVEIEGEVVCQVASNLKEEQKVSKICDSIIENENNMFNKKVITEADLRRFQMKGIKEISVIKNCILTPLAKDFIRTSKIKLKPIS